MLVDQAVHMYRTLPNAELSIIPGADHGFLWPRAELFCATIIDFLLRYSPSDVLDKAK
jgi:pimeloyl-ACP methyl ester carboxylesterase